MAEVQSEIGFMQYEHHGRKVWVWSENKGTHRENCLCFCCEKFHPDREDNCPIAEELFKICQKHGLVTPVYECPEFNLRPG